MKLLKKSFAILLALTLVLCTVQSFAADSDGLQTAILTAKSKIEIPDEYTEFDSNIYTNEDGISYNLSWNDKDYNGSISITINDKNDITNYYSSVRQLDDPKVQFAAYTGEELKQKALEWLGKVNPSWISELNAENADTSDYGSIYSDSTYISFNRIKNGIDFLGNRVSFNINNRTGEVTNMYSSWNYDTEIPDPSEAMDENAAEDEFFKLSPLELEYMEIDGIAKPIYTPANPYVRINARKGGEITERYSVLNQKGEAATAEDAAASGGSLNSSRLTESEIANLEEINDLIPEQDLVKLAQSLKYTNLSKASYEGLRYTRGFSYAKNSEEEEEKQSYNAQLSFVFNKDTADEYNGSVTLDAETGELIRFYACDYSAYDSRKESEAPAVKAEAALKTAELFIVEYSPEQATKVKAEAEDDEVYGDYYLNFARRENDIPYYANYVNVSVNSETGLVTSFSKNWDDELVFESPDGIMDTATAEQAFRQHANFTLSYVYSYNLASDNETVVECIELCYRGENLTLDAKTGKPVNLYEDAEALPEANDISGHYGEAQIKALISAGVIELDSETPAFRPDDTINKGELGQLVARLKQRYIPYEPASVEKTIRNMQILLPSETFNSDEAAQRMDGVTYIVRAIGYREVAELHDIFNCSFADAANIPADKTGYIAIARGLGIVRGDENGSFNSDAPLTRADAAIMIYNYLAR